MTTQVSVFEQKLPAHVLNAKSKAMQAMAGGLAGGGFGNRISLRNSKFRFIQEGSEVGSQAEPTLDVVIFAMANHVQRFYYEGAFDANIKTPPTCYSLDGRVPVADAAKPQSTACATCPQNVRGSGRQAGSKACAYRKRVIVLAPEDLEGAPYALDVNGMSMFGEQVESKNLFSFKGYFEKLSVHNMDIAALVTRLSFDDSASVPKLHFSPIRALTAEEFAVVQSRMDDEIVAKMLADMTNEAEAAEQAPITPPAPKAPEPAATPVAHQGAGGLKSGPVRGFGAKVQPNPPAQASAAPAAAGKAKPVTLDLDGLVNFDDETV